MFQGHQSCKGHWWREESSRVLEQRPKMHVYLVRRNHDVFALYILVPIIVSAADWWNNTKSNWEKVVNIGTEVGLCILETFR